MGAERPARGGGSDYKAEYRVIRRDGSIRWIYVHGTFLFNEGLTATEFIGATQDITERKAYEQERERALVEAKKLADLDPLTGLLNHRAFHIRFADVARRTTRAKESLAIAMLDIDNFKFFNDAYGHAAGDEVLRVVADRLGTSCVDCEAVGRFGGDEFALLVGNVGDESVSSIESRLLEALADLNYEPDGADVVIPLSVSVGAVKFPEVDTDRIKALKLADDRMLWHKTGGQDEEDAQEIRSMALRRISNFTLLDALVVAVDNKDRYTKRHSEDTARYAILIADELGLDEKTRDNLAISALLHDVGKIGVPDSILRKPGMLDDVEFDAVKQHPTMGAIIVSAVPGLEGTLDAMQHHHERWDGEGYPFGLVGDQIPEVARQIAVADSFSAMTTDRPYRKGMEIERALSILEAGAGTQWDPDIVAAFIRGYRKTYPTPA